MTKPPDDDEDEMITLIVTEIKMAPVASRMARSLEIKKMAEYYGVDPTEEAVLRAVNAEVGRHFRPVRQGVLMRVDAPPADWDGDLGSLPRADWQGVDHEDLEQIALESVTPKPKIIEGKQPDEFGELFG